MLRDCDALIVTRSVGIRYQTLGRPRYFSIPAREHPDGDASDTERGMWFVCDRSAPFSHDVVAEVDSEHAAQDRTNEMNLRSNGALSFCDDDLFSGKQHSSFFL